MVNDKQSVYTNRAPKSFDGFVSDGNTLYARYREFPSLPAGLELRDQSVLGWPAHTLIRIQPDGMFTESGLQITSGIPASVKCILGSWKLAGTKDLRPVPGPYAPKKMTFGIDWRVILHWPGTNIVMTNNFVVWYDMDRAVYNIGISPGHIELWETPIMQSAMVDSNDVMTMQWDIYGVCQYRRFEDTNAIKRVGVGDFR